jgi:nitroimidazol reductase NimA-like FMN-containing flavoprotein (pyridoxamine 5'-phosphate oxidase superfamily)
MSKFHRITDGEAFEVDLKDDCLRLACCDCGLVHDIMLRVRGGKIQLLFIQVPRSTSQLRRHDYGNLQTENDSGWVMIRKEQKS